MKKRTSFLAVAAIAFALAAHAATLHVSMGGDDANSGADWASALRTIQAGVEAAEVGAPPIPPHPK